MIAAELGVDVGQVGRFHLLRPLIQLGQLLLLNQKSLVGHLLPRLSLKITLYASVQFCSISYLLYNYHLIFLSE